MLQLIEYESYKYKNKPIYDFLKRLFDNYNNRVLEKYEERKNDVEYQYRHDWNPANFK